MLREFFRVTHSWYVDQGGLPVARRRSTTLTEVELEFMQVIWSADEITSEAVQDALRRQGRDLTGGTVRKMIGILFEKGYLSRRRQGQGFLYRAKVDEKQATRTMVTDLLTRAFGGRASLMVAAMLDSRAVRDGDVAEIKRLIARHEKGETE